MKIFTIIFSIIFLRKISITALHNVLPDICEFKFNKNDLILSIMSIILRNIFENVTETLERS